MDTPIHGLIAENYCQDNLGKRNLRKSEIILVFLSNQSINKRGYVQKELRMALNYLQEKLTSDTFIIPVKLDFDVLVPDELTKIQCLNLEGLNSLILLKASIDSQAEKLGFELLAEENNLNEIHVHKRKFEEKWDGLPGYEVEYSLPVFHSTKFSNIEEVSKILEADYISTLHDYRLEKLGQDSNSYSWAQSIYQRTNTYYAHYGDIFHENYFLSILFNVSWYGAGAAHPNHHFITYNFLLNPLIRITNITFLFMDHDSIFEKLVRYTRQAILELKIQDEEDKQVYSSEDFWDKDWINRGTKDWESFSAFTLSKEGLMIHFAPYQISSYAAGSHHVTIPYTFFYRDLKQDIRHALSLPTYD
jgi:hypothetical protein